MEQENQGKGMAIASLVLGIISLVCSFFTSLVVPGVIGLVLAIVGLVLAIMARKKGQSGMATAGLVLSIIGLIFNALFLVACVGCVACSTCSAASTSSLLY